jgi:predicted flap endonuclease-1-like 5' DNA nuclease
MLFFTLQTLLLLAIAFILGCVIGCWMHRIFGAANEPAALAPAAATAAVAVPVAAAAYRASAPEPAVAAVPVAAPAPAPAPAPVVSEPEPVAAPVVVAEPEPVGFTAPAAAIAAPAALMAAPKAAKPKAQAKPAPKPAAKPKAAPAAKVAAAPARKDDLKRIRGIGRQNEARLNAVGVTLFEQIAKWTAKDEAEYGERLAFPGRIEREEWVKQAKVLAKGGETEFSKRVDKGEIATSIGKGTVGDLGSKPKGLLGKARGGKPDNLTLIDGVGNAIEKRLHDLGIFHFDQVAALSDAEATWIGIEIGFPGRVQRENWVEEARILGAGGMTAHAKKVESGAIPTSRVSTAAEKGRKK